MLKEINRHKLAYSVLVIGLIAGVALFLASWPDRQLQRMVAIGIAIFYFIWGVFTHLNAGHISKKIVMEYLAVGTLAGLLLVLITF